MKTSNLSRLPLRFIAGAALATVIGFASGCSSTPVAAGSVVYERGELNAGLAQSYSSTVSATEKAVDQMQFVRITDVKDGLTAVIEARTAQDKKVKITITGTDTNLTHVTIRVDHLGEQELSEAILNKIKAN